MMVSPYQQVLSVALVRHCLRDVYLLLKQLSNRKYGQVSFKVLCCVSFCTKIFGIVKGNPPQSYYIYNQCIMWYTALETVYMHAYRHWHKDPMVCQAVWCPHANGSHNRKHRRKLCQHLYSSWPFDLSPSSSSSQSDLGRVQDSPQGTQCLYDLWEYKGGSIHACSADQTTGNVPSRTRYIGS